MMRWFSDFVEGRNCMKRVAVFQTVLIVLAMGLADGSSGPLFTSSDGGGTATVEPKGGLPAGSTGTWKIAYTAGGKEIAPGGGIVLQVSPFWGWTPPQVRLPSRPGFVTAEVVEGDARVEIFESVPYSVVVRLAEGRLKRGDTVVITYGDTGGGKHPGAAARIDKYSERDSAFHVKVDGDGDGSFKEIENSPTIEITSGAPVRISVVASSIVPAGGKGTLVLAALDAAGNWVEEYTGKVALSSSPGLGFDGVCTFGRGDGGTKRLSFRARSQGIFRIDAADHGRGLEGRSNPVEVVPAPPPLSLYWADIHGHSGFSDGTGTPEDYYRYARHVSALDVAALTDHDAWGIRPLDENPRMWARIQSLTNRFYRPGGFVTFVGYEWTNWTYGHMHVLFKGKKGAVYSYRSEQSDTPEKLWSILPRGEAITIPHHPGGGPIRTDWDFHDPAFEPLVEICSVHGVSERFNGPLSIYHPVEGAFVQDALKRGYRLGFLGSGDSHTGHPGMPYVDAPSFGLSGIYAEELTREGIWGALFARHTYATTGARIILRFTVNGAMMGDEVEAGAPMAFSAEAVPCGPVESFELVHNNRVIHRATGTRLEYAHPEEVRTGDYFYVRLLQENGQQAFSSPVWIK